MKHKVLKLVVVVLLALIAIVPINANVASSAGYDLHSHDLRAVSRYSCIKGYNLFVSGYGSIKIEPYASGGWRYLPTTHWFGVGMSRTFYYPFTYPHPITGFKISGSVLSKSWACA